MEVKILTLMVLVGLLYGTQVDAQSGSPLPQTVVQTVPPPAATPTTQDIDLHTVISKCVLADIVFVVDSSGSIGLLNWRKILTFMQNIVRDMIIGPEKIQVGIVTYGNRANLRFHLNKHKNASTMLAAINEIPWEDSATNTSGGIRYMSQYMFKRANGDRSKAPNIGIVITDGVSTRDKELTLPEAKKARDAGVHMFSLGIGSEVNQAELEGIASKPSKNFVYRVGNFDALDGIKKTLLRAACQITVDCVEGNDIAFVVDTSGSVHHDHFLIMRDFIKKTITSIVVDKGYARFSFVTFSNGARVHFHLKDHRSHKDYMEAIDKVKYKIGRTNTADALRVLRNDVFKEQNGDRPGNSNIAVIFTDGTSSNPTETVKQARLAKLAGIHLIVIGIGKWMNHYELLEIASDPDKFNLFLPDDFRTIHFAGPALRSAFCNELNECDSAPCQNGGTCVDGIHTYTCKCAPNFAGINCEKACRAPADIVVALDSSGSIGEPNYQKAMYFLKYLAASLNVGGGAFSRLGVETFGSGTSLKFHLQDHKDRLSLMRAISWKYSRGSTSTASALRYIVEQMFKSTRGDRENVQNVAILITDGKSNDRRETFKAAVKVRKNGIHLMSVGINIKDQYGQKELRGISSDPDSANALSVDSFQMLSNETMKLSYKLLDAVCNNEDECASSPCRGESQCVDKINHYECLCPTDRTGINCERRCNGTADIVFMLDSSGSMREHRYVMVKKFLMSIVHHLEVVPGRARIGLLAFSDWPRVVFNLNTYENKEDVKQAIESVRWYRGKTNIASSIRELRRMFTEKKGGRKDVPRFGVLVTDGEATVEKDRTLKEAILARMEGIHLMVVSPMAQTKSLEAIGIASYPKEKNVFIVNRFEDMPNITHSLVQAVCDDEDECKSQPCVNGGRCVNSLKSYICLCKDQWTGYNCERKCSVRRDVVFGLDMSGANETAAKLMHKLTKAIVSGLNFNGGRTRVGVFTFSSGANVEFHLNKYNSYLEIKNAISFLLRRGKRNIANGVSAARYNMFRASNGDRAGDKNYFILMTDGHSYVNKGGSKYEADRLRKAEATIMAVGVGPHVSRKEINEIASDPDSEHAYFLNDAPKIDEIAKKMLDYICT